MSKLSVLLVDDEVTACEHLKNTIRNIPEFDLDIVGMAHDTVQAGYMIQKLKPDAVFIDIGMPGENAMAFLERIAPVNFQVIFVTAYDEYAVKAFRLNAADYILKPICKSEISDAIARVISRIQRKEAAPEHNSRYSGINSKSNVHEVPRVSFRSANGLDIVDLADLYYIEAQRSYSRVVFHAAGTPREIIMSQPLTDYEDLLPADIFYRVHKSYLVNCMHVQKVVTHPSPELVLTNKSVLPVSRRRYTALMSFLSGHAFLKRGA